MSLGSRRVFAGLASLALLLVMPSLASAAFPPFLFSWNVQPGQVTGGDGYSICVDNTGSVYVVNSIASRIEKYGDSGALITTWGTPGSANGQFNSPLGVAADGHGFVYVADSFNRRVQKFTDAGVYVTQWGSFGSGNGQFFQPANVAVDASGTHVYVTDVTLCRVQEFDNTGAYITQWGGVGTGDGQFTGPYGVAVNSTGDVYVSDNGSSCRVEKFTSGGGYLSQWGSCLTNNNNLDFQDCGIWGLAVGSDDNVYGADAGCNMVKEWTPTGTLIFRSSTVLGSNCEPGIFSIPYGVAVDKLGNFYVASTGNHCVQKFGPGGTTPATVATWGRVKTLYR